MAANGMTVAIQAWEENRLMHRKVLRINSSKDGSFSLSVPYHPNKRGLVAKVAALLCVLALGGCQPAGASAEPASASTEHWTVLVLHHTLTPDEGVPTGIAEGRWAVDGGCLGLDGEVVDYVVLLPSGWRAADAGILTAEGQYAGRIGDLVRLGGGALGSPSEAARLADGPIPQACKGSDYWLVSELAPPESTYPVPPP